MKLFTLFTLLILSTQVARANDVPDFVRPIPTILFIKPGGIGEEIQISDRFQGQTYSYEARALLNNLRQHVGESRQAAPDGSVSLPGEIRSLLLSFEVEEAIRTTDQYSDILRVKTPQAISYHITDEETGRRKSTHVFSELRLEMNPFWAEKMAKLQPGALVAFRDPGATENHVRVQLIIEANKGKNRDRKLDQLADQIKAGQFKLPEYKTFKGLVLQVNDRLIRQGEIHPTSMVEPSILLDSQTNVGHWSFDSKHLALVEGVIKPGSNLHYQFLEAMNALKKRLPQESPEEKRRRMNMELDTVLERNSAEIINFRTWRQCRSLY